LTSEADLATALATQLGGYWVLGTTVRTGPVRKASDVPATTGAVPHRAIFILETGGADDVPFLDGGTRTAESRVLLQAWVRSAPAEYDQGKADADAAWLALDKRPPAGYHEVRCLGSVPGYLGIDEKDHHEWSFSVLAKRCV
jgi:hypothetical protein